MGAKPTYKERVNRQSLPLNFKETGGVIACKREQLKYGTRIGKNVSLVEIPKERSFDIDTYADLYLCESILLRKRVVFTVIGYSEVGLGHAYRAVMIANELVQYDITFVIEERNDLAISYIKSYNYEVVLCKKGELASAVLHQNPDIVVNDILNTSIKYIENLKVNEAKIVNFEDMGPGAERADLVINALYPHQESRENIFVGEDYFCLRDEFIYSAPKEPSEEVNNVLLTFGGVDEGNLTLRTYTTIKRYCKLNDIKITIVLGPGYRHLPLLEKKINENNFSDVKIIKSTKKISQIMHQSDITITSGGRTVLELAAMWCPTLVICQNERETTHTFASDKNGLINLGYRSNIEDQEILDTFIKIVENKEFRHLYQNRMKLKNLKKGKERVVNMI